MVRAISSAPLGCALLGLIGQTPRSGYALMKLFKTTPLGRYSGSPGAIYPALKGLERNGLVRGEVEQAGSLRPRRVYRLTAPGRRVLRQWLGQPITPEDVALRDEELTLRFALMEGMISRDAVLKFLDTFAAMFDAHAASLEPLLDKKAMSLHGVLALECGIEGYRARATWARRARKRLQASGSSRQAGSRRSKR